jgi:hypothetical protein
MLGAAIGAISGLVGIKAGHVDFKLAMLISVVLRLAVGSAACGRST